MKPPVMLSEKLFTDLGISESQWTDGEQEKWSLYQIQDLAWLTLCFHDNSEPNVVYWCMKITLPFLLNVYLLHVFLPRRPNKGGGLPSHEKRAQLDDEDGLCFIRTALYL